MECPPQIKRTENPSKHGARPKGQCLRDAHAAGAIHPRHPWVQLTRIREAPRPAQTTNKACLPLSNRNPLRYSRAVGFVSRGIKALRTRLQKRAQDAHAGKRRLNARQPDRSGHVDSDCVACLDCARPGTSASRSLLILTRRLRESGTPEPSPARRSHRHSPPTPGKRATRSGRRHHTSAEQLDRYDMPSLEKTAAVTPGLIITRGNSGSGRISACAALGPTSPASASSSQSRWSSTASTTAKVASSTKASSTWIRWRSSKVRRRCSSARTVPLA